MLRRWLLLKWLPFANNRSQFFKRYILLIWLLLKWLLLVTFHLNEKVPFNGIFHLNETFMNVCLLVFIIIIIIIIVIKQS